MMCRWDELDDMWLMTKRATQEYMKDELKRVGLDVLVRRRSDGRIGGIKCWSTFDCRFDMRFYPLKKNGELSVKQDGYVKNWRITGRNIELGDVLLEQFEPYKD